MFILGHDKVVRLFLEHGINLSSAHYDGFIPLLFAAFWGNSANWLELIQIKAMKLKWVCISGQDKIVELMIQHGANVSATDNRGSSPLHLAASGGNKIIIT